MAYDIDMIKKVYAQMAERVEKVTIMSYTLLAMEQSDMN